MKSQTKPDENELDNFFAAFKSKMGDFIFPCQ